MDKGAGAMDWGMEFPDELEKMKEKMDQTWRELFEGSPENNQRQEDSAIEKFPDSNEEQNEEEGLPS